MSANGFKGGGISVASLLRPPGPGAEPQGGGRPRRRQASLRDLLALHHPEDRHGRAHRRGAGRSPRRRVRRDRERCDLYFGARGHGRRRRGRRRPADRGRRRQRHHGRTGRRDLHGRGGRSIPAHDAVSRRPAGLQPAPDGQQAADHQRADDAEQRDEPGGHGAQEPRPRSSHGVFRSQDAAPFDLPRRAGAARHAATPDLLDRGDGVRKLGRCEGTARLQSAGRGRRRPGVPAGLSRLPAPAGGA